MADRPKDFWTTRIAAVRAEEEQAKAEDLRAIREAETQRLSDLSDEALLAELHLPDPDTLEPGADFTAFMSQQVPTRLRNRALRRLWISNPMLANLDNLVDYGEDFTDAATVIENLRTAYAVGKGIHGRFLDEEDNPPPENQPVRQEANQELANEEDLVEPKDQRSNQIEGEIDKREHAIPEEGRATEEGIASTNAEKIAQFAKDNEIDGIDQSEMVVIPKINPTNAEDINTRPRRMRFKVVS
jgi:hypothetical protein